MVGCTAVDYAFIRRMSMSVRVPNTFELIVRSILHIAIFAGPFEVKLNRYSWPQGVLLNLCCRCSYASATLVVTEPAHVHGIARCCNHLGSHG